jgi:hypothetical protein
LASDGHSLDRRADEPRRDKKLAGNLSLEPFNPEPFNPEPFNPEPFNPYVFHVKHPNWRDLEVGQDCCDSLTRSSSASRRTKEHLLRNERRKRFLAHEGWILDDDGAWTSRLECYRVIVMKSEDGWRVFLNGKRARTSHLTLESAQGAAFDFIESGKAREWFASRR